MSFSLYSLGRRLALSLYGGFDIVCGCVVSILYRIKGSLFVSLTTMVLATPTDRSRSPYHLDLMDVLTDLQRDGLVRTVSGRNLPPSLMRSIHDHGFEVVSNRIDSNLLDPVRSYTTDLLMACDDTDNTSIVVAKSLAGGLLNGQWFNHPPEPYMFQYTDREKTQLGSLRSWASRRNKGSKASWRAFQTDIMAVLENISLKHRVSITAVLLRWAIQMDQTSSVVADFTEFLNQGQTADQHIRTTRQLFRLELDEDDMQRLWEASGCQQPERGPPDFDFADLDPDGPPPSGSSGKLWI